MHEFSLAQGLMRQIETLAREHKARRVVRIRLAVGRMSGVVVDSFRFGIETLAELAPLTQGLALEIEEPRPSFRCLACDHVEAGPDDFFTNPVACPRCGGIDLLPQGGDELTLLQVEME